MGESSLPTAAATGAFPQSTWGFLNISPPSLGAAWHSIASIMIDFVFRGPSRYQQEGNSLLDLCSQAQLNKPLKPKSVKGRNKVGEICFLLIRKCLLLLAYVFHDQAVKDPTEPLWSRCTLPPPCNHLLIVIWTKSSERLWKYHSFTHNYHVTTTKFSKFYFNEIITLKKLLKK